MGQAAQGSSRWNGPHPLTTARRQKAGTCRYWKQFLPAAGEVIIAQQAHLKLGHLGAVTEDAAGPLLMTFIDESPLSQMFNLYELTRDMLAKPCVVTEIEPKAKTKVTVKRAKRAASTVYDADTKEWIIRPLAVEKAASLATMNAQIRFVLDMMIALIEAHKPMWNELPTGEARKHAVLRNRVPMDALKAAGFWRGRLPLSFYQFYGMQVTGYRNMSTAKKDDAWSPMSSVHKARKHFQGKQFEEARRTLDAGGKYSGKSTAASTVKMLDAVIAIMNVIGRNEGIPGALSTVTIKQPSGNGGIGKLSISVGRVAEMPEVVRKSPIMFADATASVRLLGMLMKERTQGWHVTKGEAERPFSTTHKVHGAPVSASKLARRAEASPLDASEVVSGGTRYAWGRPVKLETQAIALNKLPRNANALMIERYIQWIMAHRPGKTIGIIGPVKLIGREKGTGGFRRRAWAKNVTFGHHNAVVGSNAFEKVNVLFVIGQNRPPVEAVEEIAMAYGLNDGIEVYTSGEYIKTEVPLNGHTAVIKEISHEDPLVNEVLQQLSSEQQRQVYERARMTNRISAAEHVEVFAIDQLATTARWDQVHAFYEPSEAEIFKARHGREPLSPTDAFKLAPDLFVNRKRAEKILGRAKPSFSPVDAPTDGLTGIGDTAIIEQPEGALPALPLLLMGLSPIPVNCGDIMASADSRSAFSMIPMATVTAIIAKTGNSYRKLAQALNTQGFNVKRSATEAWLKAHAARKVAT